MFICIYCRIATKRRVGTFAQRYLLLHLLLFRFNTTPGKELAVLAIPACCVDKIITLYYSSIFGRHQSVIKMYLAINDKFFITSLIYYIRAYIKGCHIY